MYDTSATHSSYILADAFRCSHLVFASSTYNNGIFSTMEHLLHELKAHNLSNSYRCADSEWFLGTKCRQTDERNSGRYEEYEYSGKHGYVQIQSKRGAAGRFGCAGRYNCRFYVKSGRERIKNIVSVTGFYV